MHFDMLEPLTCIFREVGIIIKSWKHGMGVDFEKKSFSFYFIFIFVGPIRVRPDGVC
jgi:hypothetical protein